MAGDHVTRTRAISEIASPAEPLEHLSLQRECDEYETLDVARGILRGVCAGAFIWTVVLTIVFFAV